MYIDQLREYWMARTNVEELLAGRLDERAFVVTGPGRTSGGMVTDSAEH
jgi:hypothetical protein